MEVILIASSLGVVSVSILHACGGDPDVVTRSEYDKLYSPRMWR